MKTKVIFRKFKDGDIIALFPEIVGDYSPASCLSYMHIGQHGAADSSLVSNTKLATEEEYKDLFKELSSIGYDLKVISKFTYKHFKIREQELKKLSR